MANDEYVAMKMLTRFKQLQKEDPFKPRPDIGWMLELLEVAKRHMVESTSSDCMSTIVE